jgi:GDP-L-fucose synthase
LGKLEEKMKTSSLFIAGHKGMVGSAIYRKLSSEGYTNLITADKSELNLLDINQVECFFEKHNPETVILAAAKVGGIQANIDNPVEFLLENLEIQNNVIKSAVKYGTKTFIFLSSSCIYPKECVQPMVEESLMTGKLEPTNEGYALAKITGMKLLEAYSQVSNIRTISLIPCNLYGPNDSFHLVKSHVLSALVRRFVDAKVKGEKEITLWGSGIARREFMHVDDLADSIHFFLEKTDTSITCNVGTGVDLSIKELAEKVSSIVGFEGKIFWDRTKPDGMLKKCMDITKMQNFGFTPKIGLDEGINQMLKLYTQNI